MEDNDHAGGEEVVIIVPVFTPADNINSYRTDSVLEVSVDVMCACLVCITVHGFAREYTACHVLAVDSYTLACTSIQLKIFVRQETVTLLTVSSAQGENNAQLHFLILFLSLKLKFLYPVLFTCSK